LTQPDTILVLDFGSQYAHLICRRVRSLGVYAELVPHTITPQEVRARAPRGLILSGGPRSVTEPQSPRCNPQLFELGIPVLGICYGLQLMAHLLGGQVARATRREYGPAELTIRDHQDLFHGLPEQVRCWMSHGDRVEVPPPGFQALAYTDNSPYAAIRRDHLYGVQFHPEVAHTPQGPQMLANFLFRICQAQANWRMEDFIEQAVREIRRRVGQDRVLCALSGGVDSSTTALLVHRAIGDRLTAIFVDHGLLREGEVEEVLEAFRELGIRVVYVDAAKRFLDRLKGVKDPEEKRRIIGEEFVRVFTEKSRELGPFRWLAQGTLYPDVIESRGTRGPAALIKTHHNVAGLPSWMKFQLLEPLRNLYKDEVRRVARLLGLPERLVKRHPFPGPGLAVRVIGEVTPEKLRIARQASRIVEEELQKAGWYDRVWQAFAIVGDDRAVGVMGDERQYGHIVTIRVVESLDAMTADWAPLPHDLLAKISTRITNEVPGVTWVTYTISSKPPATIEPQ
jgi:GMP synthase (glutamine-hydrolysing)